MEGIVQIAGLTVQNTSKIITSSTKLCLLIYAPPKFGKTTSAATLDKMTKKYFGKPTLFIACEVADGGGTASVQEAGVDYVQPDTKERLDSVIAALQTDTYYGGVIVDSASEIVRRFWQPYALKMPNPRDDRDFGVQRKAGVPAQGDYQTMGEIARGAFQQMVNLTTLMKQQGSEWVPDPDRRKHLIVTALERTKEDRKTQAIIQIGPDLPGAMATNATAMFQSVGCIQIRDQVMADPQNPKLTVRHKSRVLVTEADGKRILGDRLHVFPAECETDMEVLWEKYWLPRLEAASQ